jgi:hypothetical protein
LAYEEDMNGNQFIRYDFVPRNEAIKRSTYNNMIAEGKDMLVPGLNIYPNPTKDCSWDCPFKNMCIAMEEGADWRFYLDEFEVRNETLNDEPTRWMKRLFKKYPEQYAEEYNKWCKEGADTLDEFIEMYDYEGGEY